MQRFSTFIFSLNLRIFIQDLVPPSLHFFHIKPQHTSTTSSSDSPRSQAVDAYHAAVRLGASAPAELQSAEEELLEHRRRRSPMACFGMFWGPSSGQHGERKNTSGGIGVFLMLFFLFKICFMILTSMWISRGRIKMN